MGTTRQLVWAQILDGCFTKEEWGLLLADDAFAESVNAVETEHKFDEVVRMGNRMLLAHALCGTCAASQNAQTFRTGKQPRG